MTQSYAAAYHQPTNRVSEWGGDGANAHRFCSHVVVGLLPPPINIQTHKKLNRVYLITSTFYFYFFAGLLLLPLFYFFFRSFVRLSKISKQRQTVCVSARAIMCISAELAGHRVPPASAEV